ncbi:MAG: hypothetical protein ACO3JL_13310, partial [Myxococcota bacterium]
LAPLPATVEAVVTWETRAAELLSALCDDALTDAEREELDRLAGGEAALPVGFLHLAEAVALTVTAASEHPAAARAGTAALQAIEALRLQAAAQQQLQPQPPPATAPWGERLRAATARFFAPVAAATCALGLFVALERQSPQLPADAPWPENLLASAEDEKSGMPSDVLELLGDNSSTEVQALESGAQMAAMFSTEAHAITVIWVPEIVDDDSGKESGT